MEHDEVPASTSVALLDRPQSADLVTYAEPRFTLEPRTLEEAMKFSRLIADSGMVPEVYRGKPGDIMVAVQMGAEVGLKPLQALQSIAVIKGRPTIWGDGLLALVRSSPLCEWLVEEFSGSGDDAGWTCSAKRRGEPNVIVNRFTIADAKAASLWGKEGPWRTYGSNRMCKMRARSWTCRDAFADVLRGLQVAEEVQDIPESPTIAQIRAQPTRTLQAKAALGLTASPAPQDVQPVTAAVVDESATTSGELLPPEPIDFQAMKGTQVRAYIDEQARKCGLSTFDLREIEIGTAEGRLVKANAGTVLTMIRARFEEARAADEAMRKADEEAEARVAASADEVPVPPPDAAGGSVAL